MANVENLNFEIILKDDAFRKRVAEDMRLADELNTHLSNALDFNKKIKIDPLKRVTTETRKMREEMDKFNKSAGRDVTKRFTQINSSLVSTTSLLRTISQLTGVAFSVIGIRRFLSSLIDITGQFEVQKMALRNMLQDIDGADKIFEDLYNFSSKSTYRFSELAKYAKQLAAFNIDQESLLETTKMLGDVASGVGVSMDRIILAYGHVKSSGFLRGIQLRSFSQNGVPVLEELSKMLTEIEGKAVSLGDVFDKMMKREITFEMVEEAFKRMTSEGGKFYQMQEVLAKTLAGQINILKGKWENLMYAIGESQQGVLKGVVQALTNIVSNTEAFGRVLKEAIAVLGAYRIAMIASVAATEGLAAAINVSLVGRAFKGVMAFIAKNPFALLAAAITYVVIEVVKANNALSDTEKITKALTDTTNNFNRAQADELRELELLVGRMKSAKEGTDEYSAAKLALEKRFDPYIQKLREEGVAVNDLTALYDGLAKKITEANKQRYLEEAQTNIVDAYKKASDNIERETAAIISQWERQHGRAMTGEEQGAVRHYVNTGEALQTLLAIPGIKEASKSTGAGLFGQQLEFTGDNYMFMLAKLKIRSEEAANTYTDAMVEAAKRFDAAQSIVSGNDDETQKQLIRVESIVEGIKNIDKEIGKLRAKAKSNGITEEEKSQLDALVEDREEQAKLYKSIMGTDYDKQTKASQKEQDKATKDRIQSLKSEVSMLEKYRDAREKLEPFFGSDTDSTLAKIFGDSNDYSTLDSQIKDLCDDLRKLGEDGSQAADQIETRLGMDEASALVKSMKALDKWQKTLRKWTKDWGGGDYHGIEFDIDKIIRDYNDKDQQITEEYTEALKEIEEAHKGDAYAIEQETEALNNLVIARRAANATASQESLNDLATKYVKEKTGSLPLRDWGDKTIGQVRGLYLVLKELANGEVVVDETLRGRIEKTGLSIEDFAKLTTEEFQKLSDEAREELEKKVVDAIKTMMRNISDAAKGMQEWGEAVGDLNLASIGNQMDELANGIASIAEGFGTGGWVGAVVAAVSWLAQGFFQAKTAAAQFEASLRAAREESRRAGFSDMLSSGVDSIFGENDAAKINNAVSVMKKAKAAMASVATPSVFKGKKDFWDYFWNGGSRTFSTSLAEMAQAVGGDLYDAYGNLNADTLQAILDTYDGLGVTEKEWIRQAINNTEAYAEALDQLSDVMESVFGDVAADAASQIVDQWADASNAALDYVDILDDVARSYAKMITQSMLLDSVLTDDFKNQLQQRFSAGDTAGAMELILGGLQQMQAMAPEIAEALEPLRPYIKTGGSSSGNTLKEGINKELVEGNSSLIASYINAMRADLSVIRSMQSGGWNDIRIVRENVPSLVEYTAQIAASSHDIAQSTQAILYKLQSVITPSTTGGSAVRTTR